MTQHEEEENKDDKSSNTFDKKHLLWIIPSILAFLGLCYWLCGWVDTKEKAIYSKHLRKVNPTENAPEHPWQFYIGKDNKWYLSTESKNNKGEFYWQPVSNPNTEEELVRIFNLSDDKLPPGAIFAGTSPPLSSVEAFLKSVGQPLPDPNEFRLGQPLPRPPPTK